MDKFIDVIVDGILSNFDFGFMFIVNVLTYIIKQLVSMGESSPAIRLLIPLAKRAITNNINSFDKFLKPIADKDGMVWW